jgi:hypothetical protein
MTLSDGEEPIALHRLTIHESPITIPLSCRLRRQSGL